MEEAGLEREFSRLASWARAFWGAEKRADTEEAWSARGVRARRLVGRLERGSALVGMDSGMGSDMVRLGLVGVCGAFAVV